MTNSAPIGTQPRTMFESEYPFHSHSIDIDHHVYHFLDEGTGDPLLFVHGNPTWSFAWRRFVQDFSPRFRVLAVDHLGCGLSSKPQDYPYRLTNHIDNLVAFIERQDLRRLTVIAHDWGGAIGVAATQQLRERVLRLVLMNTAAFRSTRIPLRIAACRIPILGAIGVRGLNLFARAAIHMAVEHSEVMTPEVKSGFLAPYDSWDHRIAVHRFVQDIPLRPSHPSYDTLVRIEEQLNVLHSLPVKLIWGMKDWCFTPEFLQEFEERLPDADVTRIHHAGHYVFEDAYDEVRDSLNKFLDKNPI